MTDEPITEADLDAVMSIRLTVENTDAIPLLVLLKLIIVRYQYHEDLNLIQDLVDQLIKRIGTK